MLSQSEVKNDNLPRKLQAAMEYALNICILGASNKIADYEKTNGWCGFQRYRYNIPGKYLKSSQGAFNPQTKGEAYNNIQYDLKTRKLLTPTKNWYYHPEGDIDKPKCLLVARNHEQSPLFDPQFSLDPSHLNFLCRALLVIERRQGNCNDRADLIGKYLWEHPSGIHRIECISMTTFDHCFVVVNRSGDLKDPSTWGNAWIIDAWYGDQGLIFPASAFKEKITAIKKFLQYQITKLKELEIRPKELSDYKEAIYGCGWEIQPNKNPYPSYSNRPVEDFYTLLNAYCGMHPEGSPDSINSIAAAVKEYKESHQAKFKSCLKDIETLGKNTFFQNKKNIPQPDSKMINDVKIDQINISTHSSSSDKSLFVEFMQCHQRLFESQKKGRLGCIRRTKINAAFTPERILDHAIGKNNRSNQVLRDLRIIKKDGTVDTEKKQAFEESYLRLKK